MKNMYIHLPFCIRKCHYCSFAIHAVGSLNSLSSEAESQYLKYLLKEMKTTLQMSPPSASMQTLYFGGGTPTLLSESSFNSIFKLISQFTNPYFIECTLEGDPGTFDLNKLRSLNNLGINRLSLGV